jgi:hypothetical protein
VFAFAWSPETADFADQQLHDARTHLAGCESDGESKSGPFGANAAAALLPGLLLADAAACFARFD